MLDVHVLFNYENGTKTGIKKAKHQGEVVEVWVVYLLCSLCNFMF